MKVVQRLVLLFALLPIFASAAYAKGEESSRQAKEKAAKKACITGDVRKGIDILGDLFVEYGDINYVFNQARCYQQNHRWEEAFDRFTEFKRKAKSLSPEEQNEVEGYVADCKAHLEKSQPIGQQPPADATLPPSSPATRLSSAPDGAFAGILAVGQENQPSQRGSWLRTGGVIVGSVGVVAIAGGIAMAVKTHSIVDDMYKSGYHSDQESSRKSYETWGWVSYGVGAAALVAGTVMFITGTMAGRSGPSSSQVSLVPAIGPDGAMLVVQGGIR